MMKAVTKPEIVELWDGFDKWLKQTWSTFGTIPLRPGDFTGDAVYNYTRSIKGPFGFGFSGRGQIQNAAYKHIRPIEPRDPADLAFRLLSCGLFYLREVDTENRFEVSALGGGSMLGKAFYPMDGLTDVHYTEVHAVPTQTFRVQ